MRLVSLPFSAGSSGMMDRMGGMSALQNGDAFPVLTVQVERQAGGPQPVLPQKLSTFQRYQITDAVNQHQPRTFTLGMGMMGMGWTINGRTFDLTGVAQDETVSLNSLELWRYDNLGSGMVGMGGMMGGGMMGGGMMAGMMSMPHPMHIHGVQFQILSWEVDPAFLAIWDTVKEGLIVEGWKDTVLVLPGTRANLLLKFQNFTGRYLHHCHILEHEDLGMMRNFQVNPA